MTRKTYLVLVIGVVAALVLAACGGGGGGNQPIKVGAIFDLTGPTSDVGTPYSEGVRDYVAWLNENGGINGRPIELIWADYAYKVDQAEQLYSQYVSEGVVAFQGWGTGDTEALRSKIAADKIPFMSASYSANLVKLDEAPYNFVIGTTYSDQAIIAIQWAIDDWKAAGHDGMPKVAILHHDSPFGLSPVEDAKAFAESQGVGFTALAMPRGATDYVAELAQIQQFGANYVIIHTVSSPAAVALKDAKNQGLMGQIKFICLNWCADEILINLAGDAAEGVYGVQPFTPPSNPVPGHDAPAQWLKAHGGSLEEKGLHYVQGWWTMAVMAEGIKRVVEQGQEVTGENIRAALESIQNFDTGGVTYPITFSPQSHRGNIGTRVYQVQSGKWIAVTDFITAP